MVTEKRLIDANSLIEKFNDHKDLFLNKMGGFQALLQREKGRVDELDNCIADVINAPTVDAVEVVRCRDCKHCMMCYPLKEIGKEAVQAWYCKDLKSYRKPDDFCSYGERKDNG